MGRCESVRLLLEAQEGGQGLGLGMLVFWMWVWVQGSGVHHEACASQAHSQYRRCASRPKL